MRIAVLGSGGWGTALAMLLEKTAAGHPVVLSGAGSPSSSSHREGLLPGAAAGRPVLHLGLGLRSGQRRGGDAPPLRGAVTAEQIAGRLSPGTVLVSVSKGIEKGTFCG